jgi:aspartate/methionine/tyrosine aminotransferase
MFSSRTRFDLRANRLARALEAKRRDGATVIDLTESNPTKVGLPYPGDLLRPLADAQGLRYEPEARGSRLARQAVAEDHGRRGLQVGPDRLILTASTSEAYAFLFKLLCDPGDAVLVPHPGYPLFDFLAGLESVRVDAYPLLYDGAWRIDLAALRDALSPSTRALVLVNPNNPTGSFLKGDERAVIEELCAGRGIALVSDEVFADYAFREVPNRAGSLAVDGPALAFALGGLSKSCGLPQVKLGWIAVSGPEDLRAEAMARLEVVADTFLSVSTPVQVATPHLLARCPELRALIQHRVGGNRRQLAARVGEGSAASLLDAEGGWYAVLRVPRTMSEEERVIGLLEDRDVLVHPGYFFDFASESYLVLSLLPEPEVFEDGVARIVESLVL